ncbi:ArdC family protein [Cyclobacterium xiamenense]|nr:ArdC family protein [Cyclobacterium xiamenense]
MEKQMNPKRAELIALSNEAKELRDDMAEAAETADEALFWASRTVNYMLLNHMYDTDGAEEFNTFKQWKEQGATIKKGSKAFLVWGQPVGKQRAKEAQQRGQEAPEEDEYRFFPICYLFSDRQVIKPEEMTRERAEPSKVEEPNVKFIESVNLDTVI